MSQSGQPTSTSQTRHPSGTSPVKPSASSNQGSVTKTLGTSVHSHVSHGSVSQTPVFASLQFALKNQMETVYQRCAFNHASVLRRFDTLFGLNLSDEFFQSVRSNLVQKYNSQEALPVLQNAFPADVTEKPHYEPLAGLLNFIGRFWHTHRQFGPDYPFRGIEVFNRNADSVGGSPPLRPDLVGRVNAMDMAGKPPNSWSTIDVAIEVKDGWKELASQAATYAQAILTAHPTRTYASVLGYNHKSRCIRFMFFQRGGVTSSPELNLNNDDHLKEFIRGVVVTFAIRYNTIPMVLLRSAKYGSATNSITDPTPDPNPHPGPASTPTGASSPAGASASTAASTALPKESQRFPDGYTLKKHVHKAPQLPGRCTAGWILERDPVAEDQTPAPATVSGISLGPMSTTSNSASVGAAPDGESGEAMTGLSVDAHDDATISPALPAATTFPSGSDPNVSIETPHPSSLGKRPYESGSSAATPKRRKPSSVTNQPAKQHDQDMPTDSNSRKNLLDGQSAAFKFWQDNCPLVRAKFSSESPPLQLFAKDSWSDQRRQDEYKVHERMQGVFGAGILYGYQELDSNAFFYEPKEDITPWDIFLPPEVQNSGHLPTFYHSIMVHRILYFETIGKPLITAQTPGDLLRAILHAMFAHFAMWFGYKFLHRDISDTNIMITDPRKCLRQPYFPSAEELEKRIDPAQPCEGLLIDADLVRHVEDTEHIIGKTISGTMSSMSRRIHGAFLGLDKTLAQHMKHSPIDDIESSIWVLILVLYQIGTKLESAPNITSDQREAKNALMSTDSDKSRLAKRSAASSPGGVFPQWLALDSFIHRILGLCTPTIKEEVVSEDEALVVYEEYFKGVLDCLQSQDPILTADWNHVFSQPLHTPPRAQVEAKRAHRPAPLSDLATLMESAPDAST